MCWPTARRGPPCSTWAWTPTPRPRSGTPPIPTASPPYTAALIEAGSDLFLTNSFGANASRLARHGAAARVTELNRRAAEIARDQANRAGRTVIVAGSMGPSGEIMAPMGSLTHARAVQMFHEQAEALRDGGADILWVETLSRWRNCSAAAEAARLAGMAWCGSLSFDTAGRTIMGVTPGQLAAAVERLPNPPVAYGANCGVGRPTCCGRSPVLPHRAMNARPSPRATRVCRICRMAISITTARPN